MTAAGVGDADLSLSLVDDDEIRELNRAWRRTDAPTDVLSFSMREGEPLPGPGASSIGPEQLGDLVISVETAGRQANEAGRPLAAELLHLGVHGLAHLLGYDHATLDEQRVMFGFEEELRAEATGRAAVRLVPRPALPERPKRRRR